jgi:outer membrane protein assembly factor BamD
MDTRTRLRSRWLLVLGLLGPACASKQADIATLSSNSDQVIWDAAQKAAGKRQWENARQHYKRIIEGFPQSQFGPAARLGLGDSYFEEGGTGNYILAVSAYREFLTFFPSHPRSDYAQFQVAEAFYKQKNGPDRDQTATEDALDEYKKLLELYPDSSKAEEARARIKEARQSLARAEYLAGFFYQRTRQACRAAITRYEGILNDYPDYQRLDEVIYRLSECLCIAGRGAEAQPLLARLQSEFPASEHTEQAKKFECDTAVPAPAPTPAETPATETPAAGAPVAGEPAPTPAGTPAPTPTATPTATPTPVSRTP